jgi:gluconokinase
MTYPRSAYDLTGGLSYFARMCHKIRLHAAGELPEDYHGNLGKGFDDRMCRYLNVTYPALREKILAGGTDEEILEWCYTNGLRLNDMHLQVWNTFARKRGWRDDDGGTEFLAKFKESSGLSDRDDIMTMFDYYDVDEKRKA